MSVINHYLIHLVLLATLLSCNSKVSPSTRIIEPDLHYNFLLDKPMDYDGSNPIPLIIFLHGAGERGTNIDNVRRHGPPKQFKEGKNFPGIIISPQCPEGESWNEDKLETLLKYILQEENIDEKRIYLTGLSMGGYGTWSWAIAHPYRFAALIPICGGGNPENIDGIKNIPIWVFHGAKDSVVPISESQKMVDALKAIGADPKFTIYPEARHDSWTATYNDEEVYNWFFNQTL